MFACSDAARVLGRGVMRERAIVVATHGHCFDGLASATLFTAVRRSLGSSPKFRYRSCGYGPQMQRVPEAWLDGDENAILDFRYTPSPRVTWYFDHHATGFADDAEREAALARRASGLREVGRPHVYYDAAYPSCTKLIADVATSELGFELHGLAELVTWADIIDAARFPSAAAAVDRTEPILQLASVVEQHADAAFLERFVPALLERPVAEVARTPEVAELFAPIGAAQAAYRARFKKAAELRGRVVYADLTDGTADSGAKFLSYALHPEAMYSVTLMRSKQHIKLSVGYNPWCGKARDHDIAEICKRLGGGGHPSVGAATWPLGEIERARAAAARVAAELDA